VAQRTTRERGKVCATRKDELASTHNYSKAMLGTLPLGKSLGRRNISITLIDPPDRSIFRASRIAPFRFDRGNRDPATPQSGNKRSEPSNSLRDNAVHHQQDE
jgi:hypothetical protein